MHLVLEDVPADVDNLAFKRFAADLVTFVLLCLEIVCHREPITDSQARAIPLGLIPSLLCLFGSLGGIASLGTFLQEVLDVLEDDAID